MLSRIVCLGAAHGTNTLKPSLTLLFNNDRPATTASPHGVGVGVGVGGVAWSASRAYNVHQVSKNLSLITPPGRQVRLERDKFSPAVKIVQANSRPLVVMIPWLMAKPVHLMKYAALYTKHNFDVLAVRVRPWHVLVPVSGTQVVATELLDFLRHNETCDPLVVHGFSVGGYLWGEVCVKVLAAEKYYKPVLDRVAGQVWDSAVDVTQTPVGMSRAIFPKNMMMQQAFHNYVKYHMRTFHDVSTKHYNRASQMFATNLVRAPALFLVSKTDPLGSEQSNKKVHDSWAAQGIQTRWKCWDCSPHVGHLKEHPEEYAAELNKFLTSLKLESKSGNLREQLDRDD